MLIAQITDTHVVADGALMYGVIPTNAMLEAAVARINRLSPAADLILATGDLCENGTPESCAALARILRAARAPVFLIPGNHDVPDALRAAFPGHAYLPRDGDLRYTVEDYPLRLIGFDTTVAGAPGGIVDEERLAWLHAQLESGGERPTLLFMHHPPFRTGIWWMDAIGLKGAGALEALVRRYSNVAGVVCGHIHRPVTRAWGGTVASTAPSTAHQVALDLDGSAFLTVTREPPAFALHRWTPEDGLVSHVAYVEDFAPYEPSEGRDPDAMARTRAYFEAAAEAMKAE